MDSADRSEAPIVPAPEPKGLNKALERNITALKARAAAENRGAALEVRIADRITGFVGSMTFVYLHIALFGFWAAVNAGLINVLPKWDESFVILGTSASVEAIFLSTFVLISQNRMSKLEAKRADLDLQISLLSEHEITRILTLVTEMAKRMEVEEAHDPELDELAKDVAPEHVLDRMQATERKLDEQDESTA
jgi:uncharacterized membrane protein